MYFYEEESFTAKNGITYPMIGLKIESSDKYPVVKFGLSKWISVLTAFENGKGADLKALISKLEDSPPKKAAGSGGDDDLPF